LDACRQATESLKEVDMTRNSVFSVVVASYVSSEDARADLTGLDDLYWTRPLSHYDAALIITDAWAQVRVEAHTSRSSADLDVGPIHDAFTVLFGGPFVGGVAPPKPNDRRLSHKELLNIGDAMGPSAVKIIALILGEQQLDLAEVLPRADSVELTSSESTGEDLDEMASTIAGAVRSQVKA
jgi:hypothetical protein